MDIVGKILLVCIIYMGANTSGCGHFCDQFGIMVRNIPNLTGTENKKTARRRLDAARRTFKGWFSA